MTTHDPPQKQCTDTKYLELTFSGAWLCDVKEVQKLDNGQWNGTPKYNLLDNNLSLEYIQSHWKKGRPQETKLQKLCD